MQDFDKLLVDSVKESMTDILGPSIYAAVARHLLESHNIHIDEVPRDFTALGAALRETFGSSCAVMQRSIVKRLYQKMGVEFVEQRDYTLNDYMEDAKRHFEQNSRQAFEKPLPTQPKPGGYYEPSLTGRGQRLRDSFDPTLP